MPNRYLIIFNYLYKYCFVFFALLISVCANAQLQKDTLQGGALEQVVVTGQVQAQSLKKSVYQVRVIDKARIQKQGAVKLQDVLANELNIRFSQDLALGGSNITMMGMEGQNVKVLIDGVPVAGRQGTSNEIDLNQIDINTIERIEIVEGPMSVMYGADALAGVINIITKRAGKGTWNVQARLHEETVGKEYGTKHGMHNQSVNIGWRKKNLELSAGGAHNDFKGWQGDTIGRYKEWHPKEQLLGNAQARYSKEKWNLRYRLDVLKEVIENEGSFVNHTASDQLYTSNRMMHQLQSDIKLSSKLAVQAMAFYTNFKRETRNTEMDELTGLEYYTNVQGDITKFTNASFRASITYAVKSYLNILAGTDANIETGSGGRIKAGNNKITDVGIFIAPEIKIKNYIVLRPGLRAIYNSVYDAPPVVPSINAKVIMSKKADIRLAYARGFRAPSLRELYFYFYDANHQIQGNTNLQAELSHSFNAFYTQEILSKKDLKWSTVLSGYYNNISNQISYAQMAGNTTVTNYINIDKYKTIGGSLGSTLNLRNLQATAGVAYTGRYNRYKADDKSLPDFEWSPEVNANITYSFTKIGLDASLFYKYAGKLPYYENVTINNVETIQLAHMNGYSWADFTLSKKLFTYFSLQGGVRNLFNITMVNNTSATPGVHTSNGPTPVGCGRSYFLSLSFSLTK